MSPEHSQPSNRDQPVTYRSLVIEILAQELTLHLCRRVLIHMMSNMRRSKHLMSGKDEIKQGGR